MVIHDTAVFILAAGESRRFKDAGFETPKPFLDIHYKGVTKEMILHVIDTVPEKYPIHIVVTREHTRTIKTKRKNLSVRYVVGTTGQAHTAELAVKQLYKHHGSVLFLDCDMLLESRDIEELIYMLVIYDSVVAVTKTFDPNASRVDQVPYPTMYAEKIPISEWGIVSGRGFKSLKQLRTALREGHDEDKMMNVPPNFTSVFENYTGTRYAHEVRSYVDWGTPEKVVESGAIIC